MAPPPARVRQQHVGTCFHPHVEYDFIADVFDVMREADQHVFSGADQAPRPGGGLVGEARPEQIRGVAGERPGMGDVGGESEVRAPAVRAATDPRSSTLRVGRAPAGEGRPDPMA